MSHLPNLSNLQNLSNLSNLSGLSSLQNLQSLQNSLGDGASGQMSDPMKNAAAVALAAVSSSSPTPDSLSMPGANDAHSGLLSSDISGYTGHKTDEGRGRGSNNGISRGSNNGISSNRSNSGNRQDAGNEKSHSANTSNIDTELDGDEKKYICSICHHSFTRKHNLKSHLLIHTNEKPFSCSRCSSQFRRQYDLKRHEKTHTREKPFVCNSCGKQFARADALLRHSNSNTGCQNTDDSSQNSNANGINHSNNSAPSTTTITMEIASESSKKDDSPNSAISEQNLKNRLVDSELNKNKRQKTTQKSNQDLSTAVPVFTGDDPNDASNFFAQQAIQEQQEQQQEQQQQQQQQQHGSKNNTMIEQAKDLSAVDDISRNIDMQFMKGNLRAKNANSNLQVIPHQDLLNGALQSDDDDDDGDAEEEEDESVRKMLNESLSNANNNNSVNSSGSMRDQDNHNGQNFNAENTEIPMLNYSLISGLLSDILSNSSSNSHGTQSIQLSEHQFSVLKSVLETLQNLDLRVRRVENRFAEMNRNQ